MMQGIYIIFVIVAHIIVFFVVIRGGGGLEHSWANLLGQGSLG